MTDIIERLTEIAALHDRIEAEQAIPAYPSERELLREAAVVIGQLATALAQIADGADRCNERYMTFVPQCVRAVAARRALDAVAAKHGFTQPKQQG